jgi:hypothetical protein
MHTDKKLLNDLLAHQLFERTQGAYQDYWMKEKEN